MLAPRYFLLVTVLAASGRVGAAAGPDPKWALVRFPQRAVCTPPAGAGACVAVTIAPPEGLPPDTAFAARDAAGGPMPLRVVCTDEAAASVLVCRGQAADDKPFEVYFGAPADAEPAGGPPAEAVDPQPVSALVYDVPGQAVPNSWAKMLYLYRHTGQPINAVRLAGIGEIATEDLAGEEEKKKGRAEPRLAALRVLILCPEDGVYRFAVNSLLAGFVLVDREVAASWPGEHGSGDWRVGAPMLLKGGPHRVDVFNVFRRRVDLRVGWQPPGAGAVSPIPDDHLLADAEADVRIERQDRSLHPDFAFEVQQAYRVRGVPDVFIPVRLRSTTRNWLAENAACWWRFGEGADAEGEAPVHVFAGEGVHPVELEVRDTLGFMARVRKPVDLRLVQPVEYDVDAAVTQLPAVLYPGDVVEPELRVAGALPDGATVRLAWTIRDAQGHDERFARDLTIAPGGVTVPLVKGEAGLIGRLDWQLLHAGVSIKAGRTLFAKPPFAAIPARVSGDGIFDAEGSRLVLVPHRWADLYTQPPISREEAFGHLVCVDDNLAMPGALAGRGSPYYDTLARLVDGPDWPVVRHVPLPAWNLSPDAHGPLLALAELPAAIDEETDVVVLSAGLRDILARVDPEAFERSAAALSDLVCATLKRRLIWVTPPPYPPDPGRFRPYAAAIRTVADARHIPVADLFTAFMSARDDAAVLFRGGNATLSERGQSLAARVIARALLTAGREES